MIELILSLAILSLTQRHRAGFSHFDIRRGKQVFFLNPDQETRLWVDGFDSGVLGSGILHFDQRVSHIQVQVYRGPFLVFEERVFLQSEKTLVSIVGTKAALRRVK